MDDTLKNRLRAAGFSHLVDGDIDELVKALMSECESARSRAEMRGKEAETIRMAMKSMQADLWVQREMFGQMQQQWVMALRKIHQMASESEAQSATQSTMR
jgi:hypothetical protein